MFTRKAQSVLALLLVFAFSANAHAKKYLVTFKNSQAFQQSAVAPADSSGPVKLLGTKAVVTQTLRNVEILVIETEDAAAVAALKKNPLVATVEEEIMRPAPPRISTFGFRPDASLERDSR
jgi:hypothetical protein